MSRVRVLGAISVKGQVDYHVTPAIIEFQEGQWTPSATLVSKVSIGTIIDEVTMDLDIPISTLTVHIDNRQVFLPEDQAEELAITLAERLAFHLADELPKTLHLMPFEALGEMIDELDSESDVRAIYVHGQDNQNNDPLSLQ